MVRRRTYMVQPMAGARGHSSVGRRRAAIAVALAVVCAPGASSARPSPPSPQTPCTVGETRALTELACELATKFGPLTSPLGVRPNVSSWDRTTHDGASLAAAVTRAVVAALGPHARADLPGNGDASVLGAPALTLTVGIRAGLLEVVAETRTRAPGFWDRVRGERELRASRATAARRVDGEIRALVPRGALSASAVMKYAQPNPDVVALSCGDLDGDGTLDVVLLGRRKLFVGHLESSRFVPFREVTWAELAPIAPTPLREPIARAEIAEGRFLRVGSTDRESGLTLSPLLRTLNKLEGTLPVAGVGCLAREGVALGRLGPCERGGPAPGRFEVTGADAVAAGIAVDPQGETRRVVAFRSASTAALSLRDDQGRSVELPGVGAALAVTDLEPDGVPEILASENTTDPASDALVVRSWGRDGALTERQRVPVKEGIRAVSACPPDATGHGAVLLATPLSLWVIR